MLSKLERRKAEKLADALAEAFDWRDTPQGDDYWLQVSENLYSIANPLED